MDRVRWYRCTLCQAVIDSMILQQERVFSEWLSFHPCYACCDICISPLENFRNLNHLWPCEMLQTSAKVIIVSMQKYIHFDIWELEIQII